MTEQERWQVMVEAAAELSRPQLLKLYGVSDRKGREVIHNELNKRDDIKEIMDLL